MPIDFRSLAEANWELAESAAALSWASTDAAAPSPDFADSGARAAWEAQREAERDRERQEAESRHDAAETRFLATKEEFERLNGPIADDFFSRTVKDSGAALTLRTLPMLRRLRGQTEVIRLHRHNLVLLDFPYEPKLVSLRVRFADLLHRIDAKQVSAELMLRGLSRRVLLFRLFALRRDMLAHVDTTREALGFGGSAVGPRSDDGDPHVTAEARRLSESIAGYEQEYRSISRMYGQAATREARIIYISGMLVGLVLLAVFSALLGVLLYWADPPIELDTFFTCLAAGAIGAFVSVLQRMSAGKFTVNHEVGREYVQRLAWFRPFIGSIFGLAVFFAFEGGLANVTPPTDPSQRYAFFAFTAFLAGFSERFAKELLGSPGGEDTEGDAADHSEPGSAERKLTELGGGPDGDRVVEVETTRASSKPAPK